MNRPTVIGCLLLAACAPGDRSSDARVERDSAGIRIVESAKPAWQRGEEWTVETEPLVDFGPADDLFRIVGAFRLRDGRIVVAHSSVPEILVYSAEGRLLERHGRRGSGPGEFAELSRIRRGAADSLVVFDYPNGRMSFLDAEGRFGRSTRNPTLPDGTPAFMVDVFTDGSLLVTPFGGPPSGDGLVRRKRTLWRVPEGAPAVHMSEFPEIERFFFRHMPRPIASRQPFFGQNAYYATGKAGLYWGTTDTFQIRIVAPDGKLASIIRKRHDDRAFTSADVGKLIEQTVAAQTNPAARPDLRSILQELPTSGKVPAFGWPDYAPAYGPGLQVDEDGNLWVAEYNLPGELRNARIVFGDDGAWLGTVVLPPGFAPYQIGRDFMIGVWRDDSDVEHVQVYRLNKERT